MIYGYVRISTDKQTTENQRFEIENYCKHQQIKIDRWVEETISSTTNLNKRKLVKLLKRSRGNDIIIASELSRLGRNLLQVMSILHHCMINDTQVWTIKDNYRLGADIQSKVLAFAFGLSAEIERNLISQRTKEALNRLKAEGKTLGRPIGHKNKSHKLDVHKNEILDLIGKQIPRSQIARMYRVDPRTLNRAIKKFHQSNNSIEIKHK